jgi:hypothetical protein
MRLTMAAKRFARNIARDNVTNRSKDAKTIDEHPIAC